MTVSKWLSVTVSASTVVETETETDASAVFELEELLLVAAACGADGEATAKTSEEQYTTEASVGSARNN